jgi:hypothetical protein
LKGLTSDASRNIRYLPKEYEIIVVKALIRPLHEKLDFLKTPCKTHITNLLECEKNHPNINDKRLEEYKLAIQSVPKERVSAVVKDRVGAFSTANYCEFRANPRGQQCNKRFGLGLVLHRKHHCRMCQITICSDHGAVRVMPDAFRLPPDANRHWVCLDCIRDYTPEGGDDNTPLKNVIVVKKDENSSTAGADGAVDHTGSRTLYESSNDTNFKLLELTKEFILQYTDIIECNYKDLIPKLTHQYLAVEFDEWVQGYRRPLEKGYADEIRSNRSKILRLMDAGRDPILRKIEALESGLTLLTEVSEKLEMVQIIAR